jgi:hypothetical protein
LAKLNGIGERFDDDAMLGPFFHGSTSLRFGPPAPNGGQINLQMQGAQTLLKALESGPLGAPFFFAGLLSASAPIGLSPDDLDVQILFDETGGISVE